jgi:hypothetical protein
MAIWIATGLVIRKDLPNGFMYSYYFSVDPDGGYREAQECMNDCIEESRQFGLTEFKLQELRQMTDDEILNALRCHV